MNTTIKELKFSEIKELYRITGASPTELPDLFDSGHFVSSYDGNEYAIGPYFLYRHN